MNIIRTAIDRPTAVISAVIMAVLFGWVALQTIPIQLAPDVSRPVITIETPWFGAAPEEIEREIVKEQEEVLKGLEGLERMVSQARDGRAEVELEFAVGTDMSRALLLTANRLDRVPSYPPEAEEPTLDTAGTDDNAIAWFRLVRIGDNATPIHNYGDFAEDFIKARIERVPGVGGVNIFGGGAREMQVVVDPALMAEFGLTVGEIVDTLSAANATISGGEVDEGKRRYIVRTDNEFDTLDSVRDVVLRTDADAQTGRVARVTVGDVADVRFGYKDATAYIRGNGEEAIAINATREIGANVIEIMAGIKETVADLNEGELARENLRLEQVYDETVYINSAIDLVIQNIWVGGALAVVILLIFLRSVRATAVVALAIPVSVIASFVAMAFMGRSLNVVSLAGIAFAVGMVVDAAIVVLENIYRHRQLGKPAHEAAFIGANQVWGAIMVSALTTVMVFIPILVMQLEVGQLFRDIAVAISVAVILSLLVSVTVIPALSRRLLAGKVGGENKRQLSLPGIDHFGRAFLRGVTAMARLVVKSRAVAAGMVLCITLAAGGMTYKLLPDLEYLPEGNRNFVFGIIFPPPGYNLDTMREMAGRVESAVKPLWDFDYPGRPEGEQGPSQRAEAGAEQGPPGIETFFFVATNSRTFMGARATDPFRVGELIPVLTGPVFREPGTFGFFTQPSIFGRGVGGTRSIDMDIRGADLVQVIQTAQRAAGLVGQYFPRSEGNQLRPQPGLELGAPEVRVKPDPVALSDAGVTARELGLTVDAFNDGLRVEEITVDGQLMDLMLKGADSYVTDTQGVGQLPVVTRQGVILPAESLAQVSLTAGPTEIRHTERQRTVTLQIRPNNSIPLGAAVQTLERDVIDALEAEGLPPGIEIELSGTADKLAETWAAMQLDLLLALVIVYLVMAILFESFAYPLIMVLSVPLATAGGVLGLWVLNQFTFQALDMLTLLGFVILIGIVVNNAILLVHQTLYLVRDEGSTPEEAIVEATRNRVRPIFMSTLTSVFGMLPLVMFPGAGSEIYRGLGSVVVGGLALSAVLTLTIIPPLLALFLKTLEGARTNRMKGEKAAAGTAGQAAE
ncbi:MAG: efflux RND transporter permease subunit [Marivibrio sp.]|uniref:efflux RND transporter permease subunit n=1 Tax=Marivibrio sp. TaxID=2039719 RepID=UPI0032EEE3D4